MDSPLDRVRKQGVSGSTVLDLMAVGCARRAEDVQVGPALNLAKAVGPIHTNLPRVTPEHLKTEFGLDEFEALRVLALIEVGRKAELAGSGDALDFSSPEDTYKYLEPFSREQQEHFITLCLDAKLKLIRHHVAHVGTTDMSLAEPKDVFRIAITEGACVIIIAHNHPSGDPTPSAEDVQVTRRMVEVGRLMNIPVVDHIILGRPERSPNVKQPYFSFSKAKMMP